MSIDTLVAVAVVGLVAILQGSRASGVESRGGPGPGDRRRGGGLFLETPSGRRIPGAHKLTEISRRHRRDRSYASVVVGTHRKIPLSRGGSVLVFGPTRSGKTRGIAVPAATRWNGSLIALSTKRDIEHAVRERREVVGRVLTSEAYCWDPGAECGDLAMARRVAHSLVINAVGYQGSGGDARFWYHLAEDLLCALLLLGDRVFPTSSIGSYLTSEGIESIVELLDSVGETMLAASLVRCLDGDARHLSSLIVTATEVAKPVVDVLAEHGSKASFTAKELVEGERDGATFSLLLSSSASEQALHAPFHSAFLSTFAALMLERERKEGERSVLVIVDEAANVAPVANLALLASTGTAFGLQLVTIFQDYSQVRRVYSDDAGTVVNNHLNKIFLPGTSDPETMRLMESLAERLLPGGKETLMRSRTSGRSLLLSPSALGRLVRI